MRKTLFIFLAFMHLFSVVGFSMDIHVCKGKTSYIIAGVVINKICKCNSITKKHHSKCCNNKHIAVKANYSAKKASARTTTVNKVAEFELFILKTDNTWLAQQNNCSVILNDNDSPPPKKSSLFLLNRVFLI